VVEQGPQPDCRWNAYGHLMSERSHSEITTHVCQLNRQHPLRSWALGRTSRTRTAAA